MTIQSKLSNFALCLGLVASIQACGSTRSVTFDDDTTLVDDTSAGTATYDTMFNDVVDELVMKSTGLSNAQGPLQIAVMTVDSSAREELGRERREYLQEWLSNSLTNSGRFALVNRTFMRVAMNEAGIASEDQMLLPKYRKAFLAVLEGMGHTPEYLLYPSISASVSRAGGNTQATYQTTLKLVDAQNGSERISVLRKLPKTYSEYLGK